MENNWLKWKINIAAIYFSSVHNEFEGFHPTLYIMDKKTVSSVHTRFR
jgi:hypothetical protein